jgi:acyl carrier protein
MTPTSGTALQAAVIGHFARHLHHDVSLDDVDCNARFFAQSGFYLGEYVLDSLSLVEAIVTLESELQVGILDNGNSDMWASIAKLSEFVHAAADPSRLRAFEQRCAQAEPASST